MRHTSPVWPRRSMGLAVVILVSLALAASSPSQAQGTPGASAVWFLGISPSLPPGDLLQFRLALAHGIDRATVARAAAPHAALPGDQPAWSIQHPSLPGYNPAVRGQVYDPARARELFGQSGWTSAISILTTSTTSNWVIAIENALAQSLRASTGATVSFAKVASFAVLTSSARSGKVPMWLYGWRADPRDFGYPSIPLGLAHEYFMSDPEMRALVERGAAQEVEQMLLDKALIIPIIFYFSR